MNTEVQTQTLREMIEDARAALDREKAERAARDAAKDSESLRKALALLLKVDVEGDVIAIKDGYPEVAIDGIWFSLNMEGDLVTLRRCSICGTDEIARIWSVESLADSDSLYYSHRLGFCSRPSTSPQPLTTEQRLLQALRDFIAESAALAAAQE